MHYLNKFYFFPNQMSNLKWDKPGIPDALYDFVPEFIKAQLSYASADENANQLASILIFLPGIYEIGRMHTALTNFLQYVSLITYLCRSLLICSFENANIYFRGQKTELNWNIVILHSMISIEEQQSIFRPVEKGYHSRIILSTNIAESSLTVDIRCGMPKSTRRFS